MSVEPFSKHLDNWLKSKQPKTIDGLLDNFAEKSFAILFLVLMSIPALPIPTGGVTHIFEIITALLALELIFGLRKVWLPNKWRKRKIPEAMKTKTLPYLIRMIKKLEKYSRPRLTVFMTNIVALSFIGVVVLIFTIFAFFAPPFSGLDTLPALGVVFISLAIILEDFALLVLGMILGSVGIGLVLTLGTAVLKIFT